jgi:Caspase domain
LLAAPTILHAQTSSGVALVIGNSKYEWEAQLPNVRRDAPDIAKRFEQLGLKTELVQNASHDVMRQAIDRFAASARGAGLAAFYYAGHGAQWEKSSYLVPIDADLSTPSIVKNLPSVATVVAGVQVARAGLMVFDSCRNNPADGWRQDWAMLQALSGRAPVDAPANSLMLDSTAPGRVALDGPPGQNSPFAAALLRQLARPSVDLRALPAGLRRDLMVSTEGRQFLFDQNMLTQSVLLQGPAGTAPALQGADPARVVEIPNAYAYASSKDLVMPPGVVACRPRGNASAVAKVGAYEYSGGGFPPGNLMVILSAEDPQAVELLMASRQNGRPFWRFTRGVLSGDTLEWTSANRYAFKWKDAHSGSASVVLLTADPSKNGKIANGSFKRLDG